MESSRKKKKCKGVGSDSNILPHDIIFDILSRLPVKSLLRFKCISKLWNKLLGRDCVFANTHLTRSMQQNTFQEKLIIKDDTEQLYLLDYQKSPPHLVQLNHPKQRHCLDHSSTTTIVGSCNGLLCTMRSHHHNNRVSSLYSSLYIWNPYSSQYRTVPPHKIMAKVAQGHDLRCLRPDDNMMYGFGYSPIVDDYEVVRITYIPRPAGEETRYSSTVDIYSLHDNLWRSIQDIPYDVFKPSYSATLVSGCLHWPAMAPKIIPIVISFQIGSNHFTEVPLLPQLKTTRKCIVQFQGKLCILVRDRPNGIYGCDLWVMENYRVMESWIKLYNVQPQHLNHIHVHYFILCSTKNGMLLMRRGYHGNYTLYNPTNSACTDIQGICATGGVVPNVESIVGLDVI